MTWKTDKPEAIGTYIILIPEIIKPLQDFPQKLTAAVSLAWFDGEVFIRSTGIYYKVGEVAWTVKPTVFVDGFGDNGPILRIEE